MAAASGASPPARRRAPPWRSPSRPRAPRGSSTCPKGPRTPSRCADGRWPSQDARMRLVRDTLGLLGGSPHLAKRQREGERGSFPGAVAHHVQTPAVLLRDAAADVEAEPRAALAQRLSLVDLGERLEQPG